MNCIIHNDISAVNTCSMCNGGLCKSCVDKQLTIQNTLVCESCFVTKAKHVIKETEDEIIKIKKIRRNITIILIIGLVSIIFGIFIDNHKENFTQWLLNVYPSIGFIWGFHIFFDGTNRIREKSVGQQISDSIAEDRMMRDNTIFFYWILRILLTIALFIFRGMLFPIFYIIRMFDLNKKEKQAKDDIQFAQSHIDNVLQHGDLYRDDR